MNLNTFVSWALAKKRIDLDGYPKIQPYQCYDLVGAYCQQVIGEKGSLPQVLPGNGAAYDVYQSFRQSLPKYFTRVPASKGARPGDIVVWASGLPGSQGYGHIAVVLSVSNNSFISLDQNWGGAYVHKVSHSYSYVLGFLRPITKSVAAPKAPPAINTSYVIQRGDTLWALAARFKTTVQRLVGLNHIKNPNLIYTGQKIVTK